ncbi:MAG: caspase family protein [Bacteroidota bacterium]|nr:caspase family protein [Bacteroidota bacterium]
MSAAMMRLLGFFVLFAGALGPVGTAATGLEVSMRVDKPPGEVYREGERILITIEASRICYLHVVYVDAAGTAYRIFPNAGSDPQGKIPGGRPLTLGRGIAVDGFEFTVIPPFGAEIIKAWASDKPLPPPSGETMEGGMLRLGSDIDAIDVFFHDAAFETGALLTTATVLVKTAPRQDRRDETTAETEHPSPRFSPPRIFGLVVGVSTYASEGIRSLRYADADARLVADFLRSPEGAGIPEDRLRVLLNESATRKNILDAFENFLAGTDRNDIVFIYMAGHGITSVEKNATYFLGYDAALRDPASSAVDQARIAELLTERVRAGKIVFFLDACHGGGLGLTGVRMRGANTVLSARLLAELVSKKNGTAFFSASRAREQSQEGTRWGGGHGAFTWYLVEGLGGRADLNDDGLVTIDELADFVTGHVRKDTNGEQHPELKGYFDNELVLSVVR